MFCGLTRLSVPVISRSSPLSNSAADGPSIRDSLPARHNSFSRKSILASRAATYLCTVSFACEIQFPRASVWTHSVPRGAPSSPISKMHAVSVRPCNIHWFRAAYPCQPCRTRHMCCPSISSRVNRYVKEPPTYFKLAPE